MNLRMRPTDVVRLAAFVVCAATSHSAHAQAGAAAPADQQDRSGIHISSQASVSDVGLPIYPGALRHVPRGADSQSGNVGFWGRAIGFKLAVMQLDSSDGPGKVASFYRTALAKYGTVLDCSGRESSQRESHDAPAGLTCGDDRAENREWLLKAGTRQKQHIVVVKPNGQGTVFQLVYIEDRNAD